MRTVIYIFLGILLVAVILALTGRKSVHHEIDINASPLEVWEVLIAMEDYPEWNPVMQLVEGEVKEGNQVKYQFTQDENNVSTIGVKVLEISPGKLLNQKGGINLVLTYDHFYILEGNNLMTKVTIHEHYRGIWVHFWNPSPIDEAYKRLNEAIKKQVESSQM